MKLKVFFTLCLLHLFSLTALAVDLPDFRTRSGAKLDKTELLREMNEGFQIERKNMLDYIRLKLETEEVALKKLGIDSFNNDYQFVEPINIIEIKKIDDSNAVLVIKCTVLIHDLSSNKIIATKILNKTIEFFHVTGGKGCCKPPIGCNGTCRVDYPKEKTFWEIESVIPLNLEN